MSRQSKAGRCRRPWVGLSLALAALCGAGVAQPAAAPAPVRADRYTRPALLVPVDGRRRLNILCLGRGSPVVVLESGAGDGAASWRKVQAEVAKSARVCAYDRAGYGFSDPIDGQADAATAASDLYWLLASAHVKTPVVLVGHSVGGLYAELFAARYPDQIAGLVLVDPTGLDDFRLVKGILTDDERVRQRENFLGRVASYARCLDLAQRGEALAPECAPDPTGEPVLDRELRRQAAQPKYWTALQSEMANFFPADHPVGADSVTTTQVKAYPLELGDKPLIVLATPGRVPPGERGERLRAGSAAAAERLAASSTRGKVVLVASGHYVQQEHPEVVIAAIRQVVEMLRAEGVRRPR